MNKKKIYTIAGISAALVLSVILLIIKPTILVYGIQRAGIYAAIALPMALVLGIVHIVNLAHGEMMMVAAYLSYFICTTFGLDPLVAAIPTGIIMFFLGLIVFKTSIAHTLEAPELNQLILTFGVAMVLSQTVNLIATSQPRKISLDYVSASATIGEVSFGIYDFIFPALAAVFLAVLIYFLKKTRIGKAASAVGQNPRGARIVGINVDLTYTIIFSLASMIIGVFGSFFITKFSIFPAVGGTFTMKSFALVAMAGIGNLPMVIGASLVLGLAESLVMSVPHGAGWTPMIFFGLIIIVILSRSFRSKQ
ncbi:branched-chain amino acid ABC transporter permease [Spirochaeta isovalerica]|uniref:Branched-chain amino acid transport system permease protein n=1 Tax=Spirochaeta isovalerica TaxID=150 RepID=A0A841RIF9_9SPIO|nr:branched-chain amino acid ABC transporter permease [Spirochaeta isovalerica]MBB6482529.1 branched-chain amino acid transport system permease protein [Spirochaeta isovalerica]